MQMAGAIGGRWPIEEKIAVKGLNLTALREQFNLADDSVRVVALVSPT